MQNPSVVKDDMLAILLLPNHLQFVCNVISQIKAEPPKLLVMSFMDNSRLLFGQSRWPLKDLKKKG